MGVYVACFAMAVTNSVLTRSVAGAQAAAFILAAAMFVWIGSGCASCRCWQGLWRERWPVRD
jgi:hypothetical protein